MSYQTWHIYGYGICTSEVEIKSVESLKELLKMAPGYEKKVMDWIEETEISEPEVDDILEYDQDFMLGLATILKEVIKEAEGIEFTACNDFDGQNYLVYEASYPWRLKDYSEKEKQLTEGKIKEMLEEYVSILTDEAVEVAYQSIENGS